MATTAAKVETNNIQWHLENTNQPQQVLDGELVMHTQKLPLTFLKSLYLKNKKALLVVMHRVEGQCVTWVAVTNTCTVLSIFKEIRKTYLQLLKVLSTIQTVQLLSHY